jgi:hypothetical protein
MKEDSFVMIGNAVKNFNICARKNHEQDGTTVLTVNIVN